MRAKQLFSKPPTPDEKRAARIESARKHVNKLFGVRGTGRQNIAPAPALALSAASGPFGGSQTSAAPEALGLRKLLWRT